MKINNLPFMTISWPNITAIEVKGEVATSLVKSVDAGVFRCRMVKYEPSYLADHWCEKGHIFLMLTGEITLEFKNGEAVRLMAEESFCVDDKSDPHRVRSPKGATAYIID